MASKYTKPFNHYDRGVVELDFKVAINADASVGAVTGFGVSVAKTGTGQYTITLADVWPTLLSAQFSILAATAVDLVPQVVSEDVDGNRTIVIKLLAAATATDPSAALTIFGSLKLKNTSF